DKRKQYHLPPNTVDVAYQTDTKEVYAIDSHQQIWICHKIGDDDKYSKCENRVINKLNIRNFVDAKQGFVLQDDEGYAYLIQLETSVCPLEIPPQLLRNKPCNVKKAIA